MQSSPELAMVVWWWIGVASCGKYVNSTTSGTWSRRFSGVSSRLMSLCLGERWNATEAIPTRVFGIVERAKNMLLLFPVMDRPDKTMVPIIQRHVAPGSTIYRWRVYCSLNDIGYDHFTVIDKYAFKKVYKNRTADFWPHQQDWGGMETCEDALSEDVWDKSNSVGRPYGWNNVGKCGEGRYLQPIL